MGFLSEKVGDTKVMFAGKPGSQMWQQQQNVIATGTTRYDPMSSNVLISISCREWDPMSVERFEPSLTAALVAEQKKLGPQSLRKQKKADGWEVFVVHTHTSHHVKIDS